MATKAEIEAAAKALYDAQNFMRRSQPDEQDRIFVRSPVTWEDICKPIDGNTLLADRMRNLARIALEAAEQVRDHGQTHKD